MNTYDINYVPQSQWLNAAFQPNGNVDSLRRFPGWSSMTWWLNNGDATYNALQVLFKIQLQKFQLQAAYTWSHSIGNVTNDNSGGLGGPSYTWGPNPSLDRGNTQVNRPQIFVTSAIYYLPELKLRNVVVRNTVGGWELSGITQYASGTSTTLFLGDFPDLAGGSLPSLSGTGFPFNARPLATSVACGGLGGPAVLNPNSVTLVGYQIDTLPAGLEPRGYCRGPAYVNTDFSIDKNWRMWGEKLRLQFRLDFFNLFNHTNFRGDATTGFNVNVNCGAQDASGAHSPCSQSNNIITRQSVQEGSGFSYLTKGPREIQYGLKLIF